MTTAKKFVMSTLKYVVADDDTVERIAARFDCTPSQLIKMNKLASRVVFAGQTILVPDPSGMVEEPESPASPTDESGTEREEEASEEHEVGADLDAECVQKFLKVSTKQLTKTDGDISGVLIITPNCVMFDPDTEIENGQEKYGMVASIEVVLSAGLYDGDPETGKDNRNSGDFGTDDDENHFERRRATASDTTLQSYLAKRFSASGDPTRRSSVQLESLADLRKKEKKKKKHHRTATNEDSPSHKLSHLLKMATAGHRNSGSHQSKSKSASGTPKGGTPKGGTPKGGTPRKLSNADSPNTASLLGEPLAMDHMVINEYWYDSVPPSIALGDAESTLKKQQENYELLQSLKRKTVECRTDLEALHKIDVDRYSRPFFLRISLDERRRKKEITKNASLYDFGDKTRHEFWFHIPREKIDVLILLFAQWTIPMASAAIDEEIETPAPLTTNHEVPFVFLTDPEKETMATDHGEVHLENWHMRLRWELTSLDEIKRRLGLNEITEASFLPLPDGALTSKLLDESMIRRIVSVLPARAQAYPWVLIYSSDLHGFSLGTMYRNMQKWRDEMSPTLLIVKDTHHHVFGAIVNCPFRVSDHFYGSGESLLYSVAPDFRVYHWTGVNNFIVKGGNDSLAIGSGRGTFGLYLDSDFFHGRTQTCETFDNEPLTAEEDFTIAGVEAFGFSVTF